MVSPFSKETQTLLDDLKLLNNELETTSQVDEFAKYSKLERKVIKKRQELTSQNQGVSTSRLQSKAAFATLWRITVFILSTFIMYNWSGQPVYIFSKPDYLFPFNWLISFPTGIAGGLGICFYTTTLYYLISSFK